MRKIPLHTKIFIGMGLGLAWGLLSASLGWEGFTVDWIKPWGTVFVSMLKLIAVPIVLITLIDGVSNLQALSRLSRMGGKTIGLYLITTVTAIVLALLIVNTVSPGKFFPKETRQELKEKYISSAEGKLSGADQVKESGPLQPLVDIVPSNLVAAAGSNRNMLQVIFFALLVGVAMVLLPKEKVAPIKGLIGAANEVMLKIVGLVMQLAPYGVFALLGSLLASLLGEGTDAWVLFKALGSYVFSVLFALLLVMVVVYPLALRFFAKVGYFRFLRSILPAQLVAFSTSSSAATLPVTMRCVEKRIGASEEVSSFVLPLGATINMDGTSIHQAVSAVFIAQAFGTNLGLGDQITIVLTATLSSIGAAAVPGAGLIMLVIVLGAIGVDPEGLALIIALDRPLDMCRTMVNVTGDATVATLVAKSEGALHPPTKEELANLET